MAKKKNQPAQGLADQQDGVVRVVTDDTPTIQASVTPEAEAPFDELIEPASALAPPVTLSTDEEPAVQTLSPSSSGEGPDVASNLAPSVDDVLDLANTGPVSHEVIVIKSTEPYPSGLSEDLFNPKVWELEQKVQDLTSRIDANTVTHMAKMSEMMTATERLIQDLRECRLWNLRTKQESNILVLAHDAIEATTKAITARGFSAGDVIDVKAVADRVII